MLSRDLSNLSVEPSLLRALSPEQKDRLSDLLDRYLASLEEGVPLDREELLRDHADLAGPLEVYLSNLETLHQVAAGLGDAGVEGFPVVDAARDDARRIGDFKLIREVGRGGMGVVYEAWQISLARRVALKVLPFAAVLDAKQIARFKNEAQAAAQLHHPHIVPVFAVGVERGVHYYAMQFIDGQPLDEAIGELRRQSQPGPAESLSQNRRGEGDSPILLRRPAATAAGTRRKIGTVPGGFGTGSQPPADVPAVDRAEAETVRLCRSTGGSLLVRHSISRADYVRTAVSLAIDAAEALHAAHEFGIVHRDVKPSNLLLDGDGKLWVTDFGLARCHSNGSLTQTGDVVGTLRYMSPEQAAGQQALVDQRTDVYSLGATLYELLALQPAFAGQDGAALVRHVEQEEPAKLRSLQPGISADLETVVAKAMAKQPTDRYATAQEFANDLRRVLAGQPTVAKPPTAAERLGKWARRHSRLVTAVVAASLLAGVGLTIATVLIAREKAKADRGFARAEQNFRAARDAVDRFGARLAESLSSVPGAAQVRRELLRDTLSYYRDFVAQAEHDPALRADLALTYSKIGSLADQIGSTDEAVAAHRQARDLFRQLADAEPGVVDYRRRLAVTHNDLALALERSGSMEQAGEEFRAAIKLQEDLVAQRPDDEQLLSDLALSHSNFGLLQRETSRPQGAEASIRKAIDVQRKLVDRSPKSGEQLRKLAASYNNLSALYVGGKPAQAAELYAQALRFLQRAAAARPDDLEIRSDVALTYNNLGAVQANLGQFAEAADSYARAIDAQQQLVRNGPGRKDYRRDLAVSFNNLGLTQSRLRQPADAERSFAEALKLQEALLVQHARDVDLRSSLGGMYNNLGIVLEQLRRVEEAASAYASAVQHQRLAHQQAPSVERYRLFLSKHFYNYGRVLRELGRADEAVKVALERRDLWPSDPQRLLTVAEELVLARKLLAGAGKSDTNAEQCTRLAVDTLKRASAAGLELPQALARSSLFADLKDDAAFAALVQSVAH